MLVKVLGILLLVAGAVVLGAGVMGIVGFARGESPDMGGIIIRMVGGTFLLMGGIVACAFAYQSHLTRGVTTIFKRLRGTRIDEEISRLAKLRGDGYITGEEYDAAKKKLLDDV